LNHQPSLPSFVGASSKKKTLSANEGMQEDRNENAWSILPVELECTIFSFLATKEVALVSMVCRHWADVAWYFLNFQVLCSNRLDSKLTLKGRTKGFGFHPVPFGQQLYIAFNLAL